MDFLRRTWAEIDLSALKKNYQNLRKRIPSSANIMAVVKADAYGHGAEAVARELEALGATSFAVSNIDEAAAIRRVGISRPILILGNTPPEEAHIMRKLDIATAVTGYETAKALSDMNCGIGVHIKFETGMGRLGIAARSSELISSAAEDAVKIASLPGIRVLGAFTHFSTADEADDSFTCRQFELFSEVCKKVKEKGVELQTRHCCNSAAALRHPEFAMDAVRLGIVLYGCVPDSTSPSLFDSAELSPVMTLKSVVSQITDYPAGSTISYGAKKLDRNTKIAVVCLGYADGFDRALSNRGIALINGKLCPVVGRVCMDMTMFDVTEADVSVGDEATILGPELPAEHIAALCQTINYELLCRVGRRVPRVFTRKD
ncbi:MAG: alanine racemase [Clostridia bacterium]|nr:alanine racemase [Clostridia bacterium]